MPRAGAASAGCGDLLLPLLGLRSLLHRGRWGCAAIAPGKEPASPPSPAPGRRRSALLSQRAPSRVTVHGKLRPVPPSSPSPTGQAGADTPHGRPPPRCRRQGLGGGRKARSGSLKTLCTDSPSLSRFGKGMPSIGARSENIGGWYRSSPLVTEKRGWGGLEPEGMGDWGRGACSGPGGRQAGREGGKGVTAICTERQMQRLTVIKTRGGLLAEGGPGCSARLKIPPCYQIGHGLFP